MAAKPTSAKADFYKRSQAIFFEGFSEALP
jgi:hypothetical protein